MQTKTEARPGSKPAVPRTVVALLVLTSLGCRAPKRAVVAQPPSAKATESRAAVAVATIPHPSWMEPPINRFHPPEWAEFFPPLQPREPPRFAPVHVVTAGQRSALTSTTHGYFIVDATDGISGPYDVGWYDSVAFTKSSLFVGHHDGGLERLRKRVGGGWSDPEDVDAPAGAIGWAAGASVLVGRVGATVLVSRDDASTFTKVVPHAGQNVTGLWVRSDDVIVAETDVGATYTSIDRGKSFARTVHVENVDRLGDWIVGTDWTCKGDLVVAALARDGRTWVRVPDFPAPSSVVRERNVDSLFAASPELVVRPPQSMPWADDVSAPANTLPKFAGSPLCPGIARGKGRRTKVVRMIETGHDIEGAPDCTGVDCIAQMRPGELGPTKTRAYLLGDAQCEAKLDAEACAPNAKVIRLPHAAFVTDSTGVPGAVRGVRSVPLPVGCVPRFVTFSAGLVLLACRGAGAAIHVATESGAWTREATFAMPDDLVSSDFEMLADGTATLTTYRSATRRQWVRQPVEIGVPDAWRDVSRPNAVAYVPRFGGVVDIVIAEASAGPDAFTLVEDAPGKDARTVVTRVKAGGDLWCLGRKNDQIVGLRRKPSGGFERFIVKDAIAVFDGVVLDGRERADPNGACGF